MSVRLRAMAWQMMSRSEESRKKQHKELKGQLDQTKRDMIEDALTVAQPGFAT